MPQSSAERIEHLAVDASLRDPAWVACVKSLDAEARRALLLRADRLATEGPLGRDRAGACYSVLSRELDPSRADDLPRLRALLYSTPGGSRDLEPLWSAVSAKGPPDLAAQAAGLLGAIAMRRGSREAAERLYRAGLARALPLGGEAAVSLNVAYAQFATQTGRDLEAGAFARRARALFAPSTPPWHRASLSVVEAGIAARFEDWLRHAAAERPLLDALPGCRPHHRRRLAPELAVLRLQRALGGGDGQAALEALEESALAWEQLGPMHATTFACWASSGVRARVLSGRADEALEHGRKALEHFAAEDDRALMLHVEVLAAAVARGARADDPALGLERLTERLAAATQDGLWAGERLQLALRLAERLTEGSGAGNPPLRLYDVAADLALDRLVELAAFSLEFPEMAAPGTQGPRFPRGAACAAASQALADARGHRAPPHRGRRRRARPRARGRRAARPGRRAPGACAPGATACVWRTGAGCRSAPSCRSHRRRACA